ANTEQGHNFSLVSGSGDTDNALFSISGETLKIHTTTNYEARGMYSVRVRATDDANSAETFEKALSVSVTDLPVEIVPEILFVSPASGPTTGGTVVTISGSGFSDVYEVLIGGVKPTNVTVVNTTTITATTPYHLEGLVDVTVHARGGVGTGANTFIYQNAIERMWSSTGSLAQAGRGSILNDGLITLPDGRVFFAGGSGATTPSKLVDIYDPSTGTWAAGPPMVTARSEHAVLNSAFHTRIIVAGGRGVPGDVNADQSTEAYDPATNTWTTLANMPSRAIRGAVLEFGGQKILTGGITSGGAGYSTSVLDYNGGTNAWGQPYGSLPVARVDHCAVDANGMLVLGGQASSGSTLNTGHYRDSIAGWLNIAVPMSVARRNFTATKLANGKVLVVGGINESGVVGATEVYTDGPNGQTGRQNSWTAGPVLTTPRYNHRAALLYNGLVLIAGGTDASGAALDSCEIYDADKNVFLTGVTSATSVARDAKMRTARTGFGMTTLKDGRVLVVGGSNSSGVIQSAEIFNPALGVTENLPAVLAVTTPYTSTTNHPVGWGRNNSGQLNFPAGLTNPLALAAGSSFTLALKPDGTVVAWGDNSLGQCNVPGGLNGVTKIAAGSDHCLALKSDGTVVAWGPNYNGQVIVPSNLNNVVAIAASDGHSMALKSDGTVVLWGGQTQIPAGLNGVTAIDAGAGWSLALKSNGTVVAWSNSSIGGGHIPTAVTQLPAGLTDVTAIAAGYGHGLAITSYGVVVAWGSNGSGEITVPFGLSGATAVAAGRGHSIALKEDGTVLAWGNRDSGQTTVPTGLSRVAQITAGDFASYALHQTTSPATGSVAGGTPVRIIGSGFTAPALVTFGGYPATNVTVVDSGTITALTPAHVAGTVNVVVTNEYGSGTGTGLFTYLANQAPTNIALSPTGIAEDNAANATVGTLSATDVNLDDATSFSLVSGSGDTDNSSVSITGNVLKMIPVTDFETKSSYSIRVQADDGRGGLFAKALTISIIDGNDAPLANSQSVTTREDTAIGITLTGSDPNPGTTLSYSIVNAPSNGTLTGSGSSRTYTPAANFNGTDSFTFRTHDGGFDSAPATVSITVTPVNDAPVLTLNSAVAGSTATGSQAYGNNEFNLVGWGNNDSGQLNFPGNLGLVKAASVSVTHGLAVRSNGTVAAWGNNSSGQTNVPAGLVNVAAVAASDGASLALKTEGTVVAWGRNSEGQSNVPAGLNGVTAIAAGRFHFLALRSNGTVVAWGRNSENQCNVPAGLTGVTKIAAGGAHRGLHSLALKSDGTVVAWGDNAVGQTNVPAGLTGIVAIAAGSSHSLAVRSNGSVVAWGENGQGQCNVSGLSGVVAVEGGHTHTLAIRADGSLVAVTTDTSGDLRFPPGTATPVAAISVSASTNLALLPVDTTGRVGSQWTARESVRQWRDVASSADGTRLVAVGESGVFTSTDSGATWTQRSTSGFFCCASSADGTKLVALVSGGNVFTSTDSGVNWTDRGNNRPWRDVASSADGTKLVAVGTNMQIFTSTDSGVNWTARETNRDWRGVASSSDGTRLAAVTTQNIFTSADSGVTWTVREDTRSWSSIASSADGTRLVAVVSNGRIYTSADSGVTWTARENVREWSAVTSSADGTKLAAAVNSGSIYTSVDSGSTWQIGAMGRQWSGIASSADGSKLVAAGLNGNLFTSSASAPLYTQSVSTNAGPQTVTSLFNAIVAGPADESAQTVTFTVTNNNNALFSVQPAISADGTLTYTPVPGAVGSAFVSISVQDDGGSANGGAISALQTFVITLTPANQPPVVTLAQSTITLREDSPTRTVTGFASFAPGHLREYAQTQVGGYTVTNNSNALFNTQPAIATNGTLTFTPAANAFGTATVSVTAQDSGGTANGGVDTGTATFTIQLTSVNDAPVFALNNAVAPGAQTATLDLDYASWATNYGPATFSLDDLKALAGGQNHTLALKNDGTVLTWGGNDNGQLNVPVGLAGVTQVGAGYRWNLVLLTDGTVTAWGRSDNGQLNVPAGLNAKAIAAGYHHALAVRTDGTVAAWGDNSSGQCNVPAGLTNVIAVSGGSDHSMALKADGTVVVWGTTNDGVQSIPAGLSGVTAIAAGSRHCLALKNDRTVVAWGFTGVGAVTIPSGLSGVTAIAAGVHHSVALKSDGTVVTWGLITAGQTNGPLGLRDVTLIAAGPSSSGTHTLRRRATDSNPGALWTLRDSTRSWRDVATSTDGTKLVAADGSHIYTSPDAGGTWTQRAAIPNGLAVTSSADGSKLAAVASGGNIYTSSDAGATWTNRGNSNGWRDIASSADGTRLVACAYGHVIATSTDSGVTWTNRQTGNWISVASSSDGLKLAAVQNVGTIYTSTDGGANWTSRESSRAWRGVACSADGTRILAAADGQPGALVLSTNSGANWTVLDSSSWWSAACSADGTKLVAGAWGGLINTSADSGATWNARFTNRYWNSLASSSDGNRLFATTNEGNFFTSTPLNLYTHSVAANAGAQSLSTLFTNVSPGPANESSQTLSFTVTNNNNALFSVQPTLGADGTLTYTPSPTAGGTATITVTAQDNGGTANGGQDTSGGQIFQITISPVNQPPVVTLAQSTVTRLEDSGAHSAASFATFSPGPASESAQTLLGYTVTNDNNTLFSAQPAINNSGTLTFTPAANAFGTATVSVVARDSGGTANGGVDTSTNTFTIAITSVNDAPSFTLPAGMNIPAGQTWTARASAQQWYDLASSADGTKILAVIQNGGSQLFSSNDSGTTWSALPSAGSRNWIYCASSSDGNRLAATINGGQIHTSTDSGLTWVARDSTRGWRGIASSTDGTKLVAVVQGGQIYTSTNSGVSWTARENNRNWLSVASSADGDRLIATVSSGQLYTSTDSGVNWTARENNRNWLEVASSADGNRLAAVEQGGQIYTSTNAGVNWTARESNRNWRAVTSSADGSRLAAAVSNGQIYTSTDFGVTWTARESNRDWACVASSADGSKLVAGANSGQLYTSEGPVPPIHTIAANAGAQSNTALVTSISPGPTNESS
ncbi:MAG: tandem-95 repeat protein, partial [Verrucomicrobia bacterium]|nr:tandem-95 repeat protein [Verrucomicrobiota bacterium]